MHMYECFLKRFNFLLNLLPSFILHRQIDEEIEKVIDEYLSISLVTGGIKVNGLEFKTTHRLISYKNLNSNY